MGRTIDCWEAAKDRDGLHLTFEVLLISQVQNQSTAQPAHKRQTDVDALTKRSSNTHVAE